MKQLTVFFTNGNSKTFMYENLDILCEDHMLRLWSEEETVIVNLRNIDYYELGYVKKVKK